MGVGLRTVAVLLIVAIVAVVIGYRGFGPGRTVIADGPSRGRELPDVAGGVAYVAGDARNVQRITGEDA
ncbi:hypothetical protein [Streptomyces sp. NBC_01481]|uniref:hypothetical protein n=1 Tax=Streptomyces sp. NBC_01481 TaxID=2975869 RepID=UPI00224F536B|nr:hypothetical protein [Streptomyces sp. NBC_01481]MCX4582423.1 hypothetical protein [Streptomyces sp. NBC_01481]